MRLTVAVENSEAEDRLDTFLAKVTGESRSFLQSQIEMARVQVNGEVVSKPSHRLHLGDQIVAELGEKPGTEARPVERKLDILFEDKDFLVLNKETGVVVHPAAGYPGDTLVNYLLHHLRNDSQFLELSEVRPGIVHRLDRGTSGILVVAKNRKSLEKLAQQFKSREVKKEYEAIAWGKMKLQGQFDSPIGRHRTNRKKWSSQTNEPRDAKTGWRALSVFPHFTHVGLYPLTGRTHQLRVHLSENGNPIVGDPLYGTRAAKRFLEKINKPLSEKLFSLVHPLLHARAIRLAHPTTGEVLTFQAKRPDLFESILSNIEELDS